MFSRRNFDPIDKPKRPRRRTAADNQQLAIPKPGVRIIEEAVLEWCRSLGICEWCGQPGPTEPSHSESVGAGGPDSYANLTGLCRRCHDSHHQGHEPTTAQLLQTAARREQYGRERADSLARHSPAMLRFSSGPAGTGSGDRRAVR